MEPSEPRMGSGWPSQPGPHMTVLGLSEAYGTVSVAAGAVTDADGVDEEAGLLRSEDRGTGKELASLPETTTLVTADGTAEDTRLAVSDADALGTGADEETKRLEAAGAELPAGAPSENEARATAQRTALVSFVKTMSFSESGAGERVG